MVGARGQATLPRSQPLKEHKSGRLTPTGVDIHGTLRAHGTVAWGEGQLEPSEGASEPEKQEQLCPFPGIAITGPRWLSGVLWGVLGGAPHSPPTLAHFSLRQLVVISETTRQNL